MPLNWRHFFELDAGLAGGGCETDAAAADDDDDDDDIGPAHLARTAKVNLSAGPHLCANLGSNARSLLVPTIKQLLQYARCNIIACLQVALSLSLLGGTGICLLFVLFLFGTFEYTNRAIVCARIGATLNCARIRNH